MGRLLILASVMALGMALPSDTIAVPVSRAGNSGDEWERAPAGHDEVACENLLEFQVSLLSSASDVAAIGKPSVLLLDESIAAQKLGYSNEPNTSAATIAASLAVRDMERRKQVALEDGRGSWSMADETEFQGIKALVRDGEINTYRPYLVRAFKWGDRDTHLIAALCDGHVRTIVYSDGFGRRPKPERAAAIIFLPSVPKGSFALWEEESLPHR